MVAPVRVLVVDDSQVFRRFLSRALAADPMIEVIGEAMSAEAARDFIARIRPDVITLDLEMPGEGGLVFLRKHIARLRIPTIVISSQTQRGAKMTIEALEAGAVDVLPKPRGLAPGTPDHVALGDITQRVKAVARARVRDRDVDRAPVRPAPRGAAAQDWVIALGASTGGVQALGAVLQAMPAGCPPIVIVQHMPEGFTEAFAKRLDLSCVINVREARAGDPLRPGQALIAPGGARHMLLTRDGTGRLCVDLVPGDPVCFSIPAVDVLFASAARVVGAHVSGAVLTGMGSDGADGLLSMRLAGAQTFAQDQATSVIYGMPARAWERGGAMEQVPLDQMTARLMASVGTTSALAATYGAAEPRLTQKGV
ncbi:MAG: chemotaxis response regulator protein-glutamate methylesterase [Roseovarius sp.]|uniref:protein-glutamate methylesterase/protein-glutamine glutaminase n=1 Tax=Roseovarius sp. TaxID=1486281 RepID=UPI0032EC8EDD